MRNRSKPFARYFLVMLICYSCLVACETPDGVTWLPDSTGFVFASGTSDVEEDLRFFDVAHKTHRVLALKTGTRNLRPAVSSDGKMIAVARLQVYVNKPSEMRLIFYDREGHVKKQSSPFYWTPTPTSLDDTKKASPADQRKSISPTWLWWEPVSQKLIVTDSRRHGENLLAVYDPHNDQLLRLGFGRGEGTRVLVRPDGQGLLMPERVLEDPDPRGMATAGMAFVDWTGSRRRMAIDPPNMARLKKSKDVSSEDSPTRLTYWERNTAVFSNSKGSLRFDTEAGVCSFDPISQDRFVDGKLITFEHEFPDTRQRLRLLRFQEDALDKEGKKVRKSVIGVELHNSLNDQRRTILPKTGHLTVDVAPDGKLIALRGDGRIRVVNSHGEIVAELDASKSK